MWVKFPKIISSTSEIISDHIMFFFLDLVEQVSFFDLYGRKLNTMDVGVSCNLRGMFFLKTDKG